jgi:hypothetical protein
MAGSPMRRAPPAGGDGQEHEQPDLEDGTGARIHGAQGIGAPDACTSLGCRPRFCDAG